MWYRGSSCSEVPLYPWFHFLQFQLPAVNHSLEAKDTPLTHGQKVSSSLKLHHDACVIHLIT